MFLEILTNGPVHCISSTYDLAGIVDLKTMYAFSDRCLHDFMMLPGNVSLLVHARTHVLVITTMGTDHNTQGRPGPALCVCNLNTDGTSYQQQTTNDNSFL